MRNKKIQPTYWLFSIYCYYQIIIFFIDVLFVTTLFSHSELLPHPLLNVKKQFFRPVSGSVNHEFLFFSIIKPVPPRPIFARAFCFHAISKFVPRFQNNFKVNIEARFLSNSSTLTIHNSVLHINLVHYTNFIVRKNPFLHLIYICIQL